MRTKALPKRIAAALADVPRTLAPGRCFVVLGPFCWGKGPTIEIAHANAIQNRARVYEGGQGWRFILYDAPADAEVDGMGRLNWTWTADQDAPDPARELARVGRFEKGDAR